VGYELDERGKNGSVEWWTKAFKNVMRFCKKASGIWRLKAVWKWTEKLEYFGGL
jgi:hypothetical protein